MDMVNGNTDELIFECQPSDAGKQGNSFLSQFEFLQRKQKLDDPEEWVVENEAGRDGVIVQVRWPTCEALKRRETQDNSDYDERFDIMIGAILVQQTGWPNARKARDHLHAMGLLSPKRIHECPDDQLKEIIRNGNKVKGVKALSSKILHEHGGELNAFFQRDTEGLHDDLLNTFNIGPETAETMLLFAAERPVFVVSKFCQDMMEASCLGDRIQPTRDKQEAKKSRKPLQAKIYGEFKKTSVGQERSDEEITRIFRHFHALIVEYYSKLGGRNRI